MKKVITVIFVNLSVIFAFDFFFGQKTLNFFYDKGIIQSRNPHNSASKDIRAHVPNPSGTGRYSLDKASSREV